MSNDSKAIVPIRQGLVVAISRQLAITEKLLSQIPAEQGHAEAQYKLGVMYEYEGDLDEAVKWYCMAAEKGHAGAQFMLGQFINSGFGFCEPEEYAEAAKWFRKAAEQGHAEAQYRLGGAYSLGEGVPEDDVEATKWYLKAAEQGHADAQYSLGHHYWLAGFWEEPKSNGLFEDSLFEELLGELNKERVGGDTGLYSSREMVPQGCRPGTCSGRKTVWGRCTKMAGVYHGTISKPQSGTARRRSREILVHNIILENCTLPVEAYHRTTCGRSCG